MTRRLRPGESDFSSSLQNRDVYVEKEEWSCDENENEDETNNQNNDVNVSRSLTKKISENFSFEKRFSRCRLLSKKEK
jgi:hypothetical protein